MLKTLLICLGHWWIENSNGQYLLKIETFRSIKNVFTYTFDQFNAFLLNKSTNFFKKKSYWPPNLWIKLSIQRHLDTNTHTSPRSSIKQSPLLKLCQLKSTSLALMLRFPLIWYNLWTGPDPDCDFLKPDSTPPSCRNKRVWLCKEKRSLIQLCIQYNRTFRDCHWCSTLLNCTCYVRFRFKFKTVPFKGK